MSYILDALKKAERERSKGRVPRLTTTQLPDDEPRRRLMLLWAGGAGVLLAGLLTLWLWAPWQPTPLLERHAGVAPSTGRPAVVEMPPAAGAVSKPEASEPSRVARPAPRPPVPPGSQPRPPVPAAEPPKTAPPVPALRPPVASLSPPAPATAVAPPIPRRSEVPPAAEPVPPPAPMPRAAEVPAISPPPPRPTAPAPVPVAPAPPRPGPVGTPSLASAVARMTLSTLVYSEDPAGRLVYIDGRQYTEGQQVAGLYLLERITAEGAILSGNGERILLPPTAEPLR